MANKNKDDEDKETAGSSNKPVNKSKKATEAALDAKHDFKLKRELLGSPSRDAVSHGRRRSVDRSSLTSETLVSHALRYIAITNNKLVFNSLKQF